MPRFFQPERSSTSWRGTTTRSPTRTSVDPRNWKGYGNRSIDDMFFSITRTVELTEEEFEAEVGSRGRTQAFATSQNQQ